MTKKILFICHGNICRSPMAEFITKKIVKDLGKENEYEIASAATTEDAIISGIGHDIDVRSQRVMNEHGILFTFPFNLSVRSIATITHFLHSPDDCSS